MLLKMSITTATPAAQANTIWCPWAMKNGGVVLLM
jgi:hypothetical protein